MIELRLPSFGADMEDAVFVDWRVEAVVESLAGIAPEADLAQVHPHRSLREQLDLDSFDFLNLLLALQERLGVEVPEAAYGQVETLDGLLQYLVGHRAAGAPPDRPG